MELISIDSSCQRSSALFFNRLFSWINSHSSKVVTVPFTLCHSLSLHRRQPLSPFLSLHFPRQSRSLLAAEWSPLQCECTCRSRAHLTACQMPDVRYQRVWELTISVFVMEHFGGNMWQLATFFFFFFFVLKKKERKTCCYWCFVCIRVWPVSGWIVLEVIGSYFQVAGVPLFNAFFVFRVGWKMAHAVINEENNLKTSDLSHYLWG